MLEKVLISRTKAAECLGIKPQTLATWACTHRYALPYVKVGRKVMYEVKEIDEFIARNRVGVRSDSPNIK